MMNLPRQNSAWVDGDGRPTRDLYNWARSINVTPQSSAASSYALGDLTNVRLSGVSDGDVLTWSNTQGKWINSAGGSGYDEGTAFPSSPATGDKFYRTDLNWLCFYDGTRWLTCHEYSEPIALASGIFFTTNSASGYTPIRSDFRPYLTTLTANLRVAGTNNGTNYWTLTFVSYSASSAKTTIATFNTATYSGGNYQSFGQAVNSPVTSGDFFLGIDLTRFGGPGTLGVFASIQYRLIVT